jgi:hypothetical protein
MSAFLVQLLSYNVTIDLNCLHTPMARMRPLFVQPMRNEISMRERAGKKQQRDVHLHWVLCMAIESHRVAGTPGVEVHALAQQLTPDSSLGVLTLLIWALDVRTCNQV